jgi:hypothetical protein
MEEEALLGFAVAASWLPGLLISGQVGNGQVPLELTKCTSNAEECGASAIQCLSSMQPAYS